MSNIRITLLVTTILLIITGCSTIKVQTKPENATVYLCKNQSFNENEPKNANFYEIGKSPVDVSYNPKTINYTFKAKKKGYYDSKYYNNSDIINSDNMSIINIELKKIEQIMINSAPVNSDIYISYSNSSENDFEHIGLTPLSYTPIQPKFRILAKKNGYFNSEEVSFDVTKQGDSITIALGAEKKGTLELNSNTDDVKIFIDGKYQGNITSTGFKSILQAGFHKICAQKDKYKKQEIDINILANQTSKHYFDLIPIKYGYIKLTANEGNVDVYIDGKLSGNIQDKSFNKKIETGNHEIMVKKRFYNPITISVPIEEKDVLAYDFDLVKAGQYNEEQPSEKNIKQAKGNLTVVTERNDLIIYLDGIKKIPPFELQNIAAGIYDLHIKGPKIDKTRKITVNNQEDVFIDLDDEL